MTSSQLRKNSKRNDVNRGIGVFLYVCVGKDGFDLSGNYQYKCVKSISSLLWKKNPMKMWF